MPLYDWKLPIKAKIDLITRKMYGAAGVYYTKPAERQLERAEHAQRELVLVALELIGEVDARRHPVEELVREERLPLFDNIAKTFLDSD